MTDVNVVAETQQKAPARTFGSRLARWILLALGIWVAVGYSLVFAIFVSQKPPPDNPPEFFDGRAIIFMGGALLVAWCLIGGVTMWLLRDPLTRLFRRIPIEWHLRFVFLCIAFALMEEAVTTSLTNLAPYFGGVTDAARITASKNYLEVVCLNSVIVFIPSYFCWAIILSFVDFSAAEVMLLYGLTGFCGEMMTFGWHKYGEIGMWAFIYGLMVWLPARTIPPDRKTWRARVWMWPFAVVIPLFFGVVLIPTIVPLILLYRWFSGYTGP